MSRPRCSIVIPVHNRVALTAQCLDSILSSPPKVSFEIVVVDDASTDSTAAVLERYGRPVRAVRRKRNGGFATACNEGAAAARGKLLVFLNNDTRPARGWLDALVRDADRHREAAVIGAKLLFPNDTVQHAGVVVCQDGNPRHVYAGFPADHPAVNKSRAFQAVTAACMLVRREAFDEVDGFDPEYRNSLEDVDLCLKIGQRGHQVRLCHRSVLEHLESASRGRRSQEIAHSRKVFARRWADRAERDDLRYYLEDGLLTIDYRDTYPIKVAVSPLLAGVQGAEREAGRMIELQAGQVGALLRETVRLTSHVADLELETALRENGKPPPAAGRARKAPDAGHVSSEVVEALAGEVRRIEHEILEFQTHVAAVVRGRPARWREVEPISPGQALVYRNVKTRLQALVDETVPAGATVLVVSKGDEELLELGDRSGWHFPRNDDGRYTGFHPKDSNEAIDRLETLRVAGAGWLVIPETSLWWLKHYRKFARHVRDRYSLVMDDAEAGMLFRLDHRAD